MQHHYSRVQDELRYNNLLSSSNVVNQDRILSCAGPGASGWLTAIPYCGSLSLSNEEFSTLLLLRLGLPIPICGTSTICSCGQQFDILGHHALSCCKGGWLQIRHNNLRDVWLDILKQAGFSTQKEIAGLFSCADEELEEVEATDIVVDTNPQAVAAADSTINTVKKEKRPGRRADIVVHRFVDGPTALFDVTVTGVHPSGSTTSQGHSASSREQSKIRTYGADALRNGYLFEPLAFETFGLVGKQVLYVLEKTSTAAASDSIRRQGCPFPDFMRSFYFHAFQRLSVCLQKWNAQIICRKASACLSSSSGSGGSTAVRGPSFDPHKIRVPWTDISSSFGDRDYYKLVNRLTWFVCVFWFLLCSIIEQCSSLRWYCDFGFAHAIFRLEHLDSLVFPSFGSSLWYIPLLHDSNSSVAVLVL